MGAYDDVVMLDEPLTCPAGHPVGGLQTKSFPEPSLGTYLIQRDRVLCAAGRAWRDDEAEERTAWRISGNEAVREVHYRLEPVSPPADVRVYSHCDHCEPILVRVERTTLWGDIVDERRLFVEFLLNFPEGEPMRVDRVTGGRDEEIEDLRRNGLRVLGDDDPLAVAHREIRRARRESGRR